MTTMEQLPPIVLTSEDHERLSQLATAAEDRFPEVSRRLYEELDRARILEPTGAPTNAIGMNTAASVRDDLTGEVRDLTLVYPGDEDIKAGKISILTPVGAALIGLSAGMSISWTTRNGKTKRLTVLRVLLDQPQPEVRAAP